MTTERPVRTIAYNSDPTAYTVQLAPYFWRPSVGFEPISRPHKPRMNQRSQFETLYIMDRQTKDKPWISDGCTRVCMQEQAA